MSSAAMSTIEESAASAALFALYPEAEPTLRAYAEILAGRGIEWGLMGPREGDKIWGRHISNSLALADLLPEGSDVADVGSGAGLPGLPLAIARPDLQMTLIEPLLRRANFLELAVDELGLGDRVAVRRDRAEDVHQTFDAVVCRAVAPLGRLLGWTSGLFLPHGMLLALKGQSAEAEILKARKDLRKQNLEAEVLEVQACAGVEGTRAVRIRRAEN
ncbi:16S rRNA (guanine(527)-N(7))-methyltransferase RsmG [Tessaracoccus caeni]|uniref:16S rRNA (guanine(527)-N(7))-methyltransferase RsmG n=1 Tax=Tessaracoccus caeni TaxID=3031239 RepID=UPI0023DA19A8|nr:16S rRNA (guanine(527)-N(7))-methyltransferase RsmG [Tessaracoccus caeni]MDF1488106.1 16S rRNA (guanine(527)-N(7))-methyltransferase RsmG [Tessaracoccus caeni]